MTLPILIIIGSDTETHYRSIGIFFLLTYVIAAPGALLCSIIGLSVAIKNWSVGFKEKAAVFCHCIFLGLGGYLILVALNFPRIGPH